MAGVSRLDIPFNEFFSRFPFMADIDCIARKTAPVLVVGGALRDFVLRGEWGAPDVTSPQAPYLVRKLDQTVFKIFPNRRFLTFKVLHRESGAEIDFAQSRREFYPHPAALPVVSPASVYEDFYRRDFTITAYAFFLGDYKGYIFDPFGGLEDTRRRILRIFRRGLFIEDPTRILRGLRFVSRFSLVIEKSTSEEILSHIDFLAKVSGERIKKEFKKAVLSCPLSSLEELYSCYGVKKYIFGGSFDMSSISDKFSRVVSLLRTRVRGESYAIWGERIWFLFLFLVGRSGASLEFPLSAMEERFWKAGVISRSSLCEALWFLRDTDGLESIVSYFFQENLIDKVIKLIKNPLSIDEKKRMLELPPRERSSFMKETFLRKIKIYVS